MGVKVIRVEKRRQPSHLLQSTSLVAVSKLIIYFPVVSIFSCLYNGYATCGSKEEVSTTSLFLS